MRVRFDDQIFSATHRRGGISNYFVNLISQFEENVDLGIEPIGLPLISFNHHLEEAGRATVPKLALLERRRALHALNVVQHARNRVRGQAAEDVLHQTYYFNPSWRPRQRRPVAVTVYDMMPEMYPKEVGPNNPHFHKDFHIRHADVILCISETTKNDMLSFYPDLDVPIFVTPLGVAPMFKPSAHSATEDYLLYVGTRSFNKNFSMFARAAARAISGTDLRIKIVGGGVFRPDEIQFLSSIGLSDKVDFLRPSDAELVGLYQNALAFVFPTKYEGFGLPTIEAMASGCPAILAPTSALQEIAGDAGIMVPEYTDDAFEHSIRTVISDPELRKRAREAGIEQAAKFSWSGTARLTAEAYAHALSVR